MKFPLMNLFKSKKSQSKDDLEEKESTFRRMSLFRSSARTKKVTPQPSPSAFNRQCRSRSTIRINRKRDCNDVTPIRKSVRFSPSVDAHSAAKRRTHSVAPLPRCVPEFEQLLLELKREAAMEAINRIYGRSRLPSEPTPSSGGVGSVKNAVKNRVFIA